MTGLYDIHCHLLPDVDDGSDSLEETEKMLRMEYEQGVRFIFATPHYRRHVFEPSMEEVYAAYQKVRKIAFSIGDGIQVFLGCEYHANMEMSQQLERRKRPTMGNSRYVLTEFSGRSEFSFVRERVNDLLLNGFVPLIAHIERYPNVTKSMEYIEILSDMGAMISVNADSVIGLSGLRAKYFCKKLIKRDLLDYIGSDAHGCRRRTSSLGACAVYLKRKYGKAYAKKILVENPRKILEEPYM